MRGKEVRLIGPNNDQLGIVTIEEALKQAAAEGLDLVLVADNATPAVCRIMNFGKHIYEQNKREREHKKKQVTHKNKEVKFRANIDPHDYSIKVTHILEFLEKGNRVKVSLQFRGREMAHREIGMELMQKVIVDCAGKALVDLPPRMQGRTITMQLSPEA